MTTLAAGAYPAASATDGDRQRARAMAVARAAERLAARRGVTLPANLRLWTLAGGRPAPTAELAVGDAPDDGAGADQAANHAPDGSVPGHHEATSDAGYDGERTRVPPGQPGDTWLGRSDGGEPPDGGLAEVLEAATSAEQRRSTGLHVTPGWLADHLVTLGLRDDLVAGRRSGIVPKTASTESVPADGRVLAGRRRLIGGVASVTAHEANQPAVRGRQRDAESGLVAERVPTVCDPACGGGAFLVAAAEALHRRGVGRAEVVRGLLWGADIDPVGLAAAEAALAVWSRGEVPPPGRLVVGDPLRDGVGVWPDRPAAGFGLVVGNPPFQNQLGRVTARPRADRERLRARFGGVVRAYTDTAWLFLLLACELAEAGGRAVLVQPESVMAARDAAAVRAAVDRRARIVDLWVDDHQVFAARVRVCAPVLQIDRPDPGPATRHDRPSGGEVSPSRDGESDGEGVSSGPGGSSPAATSTRGDAAGRRGRSRSADRGGDAAVDTRPPRRHVNDGPARSRSSEGRPGAWHDLLADATGIPRVVLDASAGRLGDQATFVAGFRDEYYGLAALVREARPAAPTGVDLSSGSPGSLDRAAGRGRPEAVSPRRRVEARAATARSHGSGRDTAGSGRDTAGSGRDTAGSGWDTAGSGRDTAGSGRDTAGPRPGAAVSGPGRDLLAPLVTAGAIDWGRSAWSLRPLRFAKRQWAAPAVDLARLDSDGSPAARRWVDRTLVPKIVVATQTNVLEVAVDEHGAWVPSVPVIAVVPERPDDLWLLAAALASPAATVWLARRTPGVGLHRGALKVSRRDLAELPLPPDRAAWEEAAAALHELANAPGAVHRPASASSVDPDAFERFVTAAAAAYGSEPTVVGWWRRRLPRAPMAAS